VFAQSFRQLRLRNCHWLVDIQSQHRRSEEIPRCLASRVAAGRISDDPRVPRLAIRRCRVPGALSPERTRLPRSGAARVASSPPLACRSVRHQESGGALQIEGPCRRSTGMSARKLAKGDRETCEGACPNDVARAPPERGTKRTSPSSRRIAANIRPTQSWLSSAEIARTAAKASMAPPKLASVSVDHRSMPLEGRAARAFSSRSARNLWAIWSTFGTLSLSEGERSPRGPKL
jgi:hypothetical protein